MKDQILTAVEISSRGSQPKPDARENMTVGATQLETQVPIDTFWLHQLFP